MNILAAPDPGCRTLPLRFDDPAFTTTLALDGPDVRGVHGPVTPPWSTTLLRHGVHPVVLLDAQQQPRTLDDALGTLLRQGVVTSVELARERFLHALLTLRHQRAELHVTPGACPLGEAVPRVSVQGGVEDLTCRRALGRPDGAPSLTQAYAASPARVVEAPDGTPEALVYRAALQGWKLQDMVRRLPLRWDTLRDMVGQLSVTWEIWPQDVTRSAAVHARLAAGQVAPDFVLPALGGGDLRLSALRGRRVWLSFNRQSTCAICNPRHAAVVPRADGRADGEHLGAYGGGPRVGHRAAAAAVPGAGRPGRSHVRAVRADAQPARHAGPAEPGHDHAGFRDDGRGRPEERRGVAAHASGVPDRAGRDD